MLEICAQLHTCFDANPLLVREELISLLFAGLLVLRAAVEQE